MDDIGSDSFYQGDDYQKLHPDWHAEDGPGKAKDIWHGMLDALGQNSRLRICEVGCGTGAILAGLSQLFANERPSVQLELVGMDIAPYAIEAGRKMFPSLDLRSQNFLDTPEHFDVILFCDVLEHLENPFEFLRKARSVGQHMVVRQPLQGDLGVYRLNSYPKLIEGLGHIQYFNSRSFPAICAQTGWLASDLRLVAPWDMHTFKGRRSLAKTSIAKLVSPSWMSFLTSGYYLNGSFRRT
jgi:SAM-dependent methyltransferase